MVFWWITLASITIRKIISLFWGGQPLFGWAATIRRRVNIKIDQLSTTKVEVEHQKIGWNQQVDADQDIVMS